MDAKSLRQLVVAGFFLMVMGSAVHAQGIVPVEQTRTANTFLIVPQCAGEAFDSDEAQGFEPFDGASESLLDCDSGLGSAAATQQSQIFPHAMTASGTGGSMAQGPVPNVIHAFGDSLFRVTFELDSAVEFSLDGVFSAESTGGPVLVGASISLRDAQQQAVFDHVVEPGPDGILNSRHITETGVLLPGTYTLQAQAGSFIDNDVPPTHSADTAFDFDFFVGACPGDLDDDNLVGSSDLAMMLAVWGPDQQSAADLNLDGAIGAADLSLLLGSWGPCE